MSFQSRFPSVARLMSSVSGAGASPPEDPPVQDDQNGDDNDDQNGGGDDANGSDDQNSGGGGDTAARGNAPSRTAMEQAFTRDADNLVNAERDRCVGVFTSEAGKRNPDAAAKLLAESGMSKDAIIGVLDTVGGSAPSTTDARQRHRNRLNDATETRVETGEGRDAQTGRESTLEKHKAERKRRNATALKRGAVKADRGEFDADDDA